MTLDQNQVRKVFLEGLRFCKWLLYSGATGLLVGAVAAAFHLGIDWGAELRGEHPWILYFLPLGGIAIVLLYRLSGMEKDQGTNLVLIAVREAEPMRLRTAPLIFVATILTHLVGGSAGREGAALQLGGSLGAWLGRVVRNKALNRLRALGGELPLEEDWLALEPDRRPGPAEAVEQAERAELIRALLNGLPPQDRAIFLRHYYYGQTAADIGAALAMPPSTVKVRLHRGRRKLKELLMERGYSCACADD